jgi:Protein of unknown function (DUF2852)
LTSISMTRMPQNAADTPSRSAGPPHIAVQILGLLMFGGFAIVATVLAFVHFWPAGFALAVILAWIGFGPILHPRQTLQAADLVAGVMPQRPQSDHTGNTSFDTYRADILTRLEDERKTFISFLERLRAAKDKSEFDSFMDDRATANRAQDAARNDSSGPAQPGPGEY